MKPFFVFDQPVARIGATSSTHPFTPNRYLARTLAALMFCFALPLDASAEIAGSLVIAGNGPEQGTMESLARAFEKIHPRTYIDILWDDNSKPLELVKTGHAHIAVTGSEDPALAATQIGWDGIGILVHLSNFTKEVTKQQVADIFSGKVKTWSELGGPDTRILVIDRPRNQNIREAFEAQLGIAGKISDAGKMIGGDEKVVKTVVGTLPPLSAVSYLSLSTGLSVVSSGVAVRLLPVDKVEPEIPTVKDGRYSLRRPLLMLSKKEPNPLVDAFAQFALSAQGQTIIGDIFIPMPNK
jgi:phosphate transport system substrate-binding protein